MTGFRSPKGIAACIADADRRRISVETPYASQL